MEVLLNNSKPDLVILTGDSISGYAYNPGDENFFFSYWNEFVKPFEKYKVPYCYV